MGYAVQHFETCKIARWTLNWGVKGLLRCFWFKFHQVEIGWNVHLLSFWKGKKYRSMHYSQTRGLKWWANVLVSPGIQLIFFFIAVVWINHDNNVDNTLMFWLLLSSANPKSRTAGLNWWNVMPSVNWGGWLRAAGLCWEMGWALVSRWWATELYITCLS